LRKLDSISDKFDLSGHGVKSGIIPFMNNLPQKIGQFLFPERIRRYLTFRLMTVCVTVVFLANFAVNVLSEPDPSSDAALRIDKMLALMHSPFHLFVINVYLALGFWTLYATRKKRKYYWIRVVFYGMLLGGLFMRHHGATQNTRLLFVTVPSVNRRLGRGFIIRCRCACFFL
jgi:hypothetical protein